MTSIRLDNNYIEIEYAGWKQKGVNIYKVAIWKDECGCIFNEIKAFFNIKDALSWATKKALK